MDEIEELKKRIEALERQVAHQENRLNVEIPDIIENLGETLATTLDPLINSAKSHISNMNTQSLHAKK